MTYGPLSALLSALLLASATAAAQPSAPTGPKVGQTTVPRALVVDQMQLPNLSPHQLAANFVDRVIHDLPVEEHLRLLADLDADALDAALVSHAEQMAFWINIYNGHAQYFLKSDPSLYLEDRGSFFGKDQIRIAGYTVSLEDIEHGVLRRGATIYTLGLVRLLFTRSAFIRQFAVDRVDYRLHFALNCGARSCPPVAVYQPEQLEEQLDASSRAYLQQEVRVDADKDEVHVPALLRWFSADFGSTEDKQDILKKYGLIPEDSGPDLHYLDYDWTLDIRNYAFWGDAAQGSEVAEPR